MDPVNRTSPTEPCCPDEDIQRPKQWQSEFPYHWDADELASRRDLLQFAVYASGTLFLATAFLAVLRRFLPAKENPPKEIAQIADVPHGEALYFHYPGPEDQAVLLRLNSGRFVAYSQTCTHLSCSVYYQKDQNRLFCPCHEGVFDTRTGEPIAGPPVRPLPRITLQANGEKLYAIGVEP
ncbi:MAG TPA: ubiquinol-cytochrome c reductase iron-sulfur subunit [Terriglobales bacterium]|nr:ubiquinol-cytochrome c reductase iron-sulfur subunit [Terriglobales bacterium]